MLCESVFDCVAACRVFLLFHDHYWSVKAIDNPGINPGITNSTEPNSINVITSSEVTAKMRQRRFSAARTDFILIGRSGAIIIGPPPAL